MLKKKGSKSTLNSLDGLSTTSQISPYMGGIGSNGVGVDVGVNAGV